MKSGTLFASLVAVCFAAVSFCAHAETKDNPYQVIIDRNPFGLKPIPPPPPPVTETSAPPAPPLEVKLTGISTLLGPAKAFLEIINTQTKKTDRPAGMLVGEKQYDVEVLDIDPQNGTVRVRNGDAEQTLDFVNNGIKPAGGGGAPTPGAVAPPVPLNTAPMTTGLPAGNGSRALVAGGAVSSPTPTIGGAMANPGFNGAGGIPARPLRAEIGNNVLVAGGGASGVPNSNPTPTAQAPAMSREEVEMRIEAQRRLYEEKERSGQSAPGTTPLRILPPTRFTPPTTPGVPGQ